VNNFVPWVVSVGAGYQHAIAGLEVADHGLWRYFAAGVERTAVRQKYVAVALTFRLSLKQMHRSAVSKMALDISRRSGPLSRTSSGVTPSRSRPGATPP
jgi:hypothetical protein